MSIGWSTSLKTAPATEPLRVEEAKAHLNEVETDNDALIGTLIQAAREYVETYTRRALITQTWYLKLDGFPCMPIMLPRPPLVSITSVSYVDSNGVTQTWVEGAAGYQLVKPVGPKAQYAAILPAYSISYPSTRCQPESVTIEYVCGYGAAAAVPASIVAAMKLLIGHWYENRESVVIGDAGSELPVSVAQLLWPYKVFGL